MPIRFRIFSRAAALRLLVLLAALMVLAAGGIRFMTRMPGESFRGPLPPLTAEQRQLAAQLERDVRHLSETIGERHVDRPESLDAAADFIQDRLTELGYQPHEQTYRLGDVTCRNLVVEIGGSDEAESIVLIGAHYDTVPGSPGADDNASAVAVLLAMAERLQRSAPARTLRLAWFTNEEPPHFQTPDMGSYVYAQACRERGDRIEAMVALDGLGYYSDEPGSQSYPAPFDRLYPDRGDFIAFVTRLRDRRLLRRCIGAFRAHAAFPSEGGAVPAFLPGVSWSDHWAFWQFNYPALLITNTLPFRNPHYHSFTDTPDRLDYDRMALLTEGLLAMVRELTGAGGE